MEKIYDADYLAKTAKAAKFIKDKSYDLLKLSVGQKVLDLGCGNGFDVIEISKIVGNKGEVVGIDHDPRMIEAAAKNGRAYSTNNIKFIQSEATSIPFEDNYFDAVRIERVFQHLVKPMDVMKEALRVLKSKGNIALLETDWPSLSIYSNQESAGRRVVDYLVNKMLINGNASRFIIQYFNQAKIENIKLEVLPIIIDKLGIADDLIKLNAVALKATEEGVISEAEFSALMENLKLNDSKNHFFASMNIVVFSAEK